ncbi:uncharacterized protein LOC100212279 [Hydra vulgaris]|uniref:uncharacterized protein LOC100212279 n=1 Tax=Hydra vulgaris TaxID=6087 RepID=UPI0002B43FDF|nr:uncharacterized protein LOC100212279 [Hydra vulgaris]
MKLIIFACLLPIIVSECAINNNNNNNRLIDLKWVLLRRNLCFQARNDLPGFVPVYENGWLVATKLVYVSGSLKCWPSAQGSNFGCTDDHTKFSVYVCDGKKQTIFPSPNQALTYDGTKSYQYPGFTANDNEVIFTEFSYPAYMKEGQHITIWSGEDLYNSNEGDNSGIVCVNVFGSFANSLN